MKKLLRKVLKILGIAGLSIIGVLIVCLIVLRINSPGRLDSLKDQNGNEIAGSLSEKNFIEIGGIQQGYFIRAENSNNPVILFLHGGPGSPQLPMLIPNEINERLEKYFVVCYWDQRGAGMSFKTSIDPATMTIEQMVEDTRQITEHLKERFNQEKIFLMGHSWGSFLGVKTIEKHPENYFAYIGIGQVTNQIESERLAYDFMFQHAIEINDQRAIRDLQKFDKNAPEFPDTNYTMGVRTRLMNKYGIGFTREKMSMLDAVVEVLLFKGYTFLEKIRYVQGMLFSQEHLWDSVVITNNFFETSTLFEIPVYIIHGKYDYQVSHTLAYQWLKIIEAPDKAFFTFENSAHSPIIEEQEKFVQVVRNVASKAGF
jgi:pimeloyl-ACP methyl ester carboxylesterase